MLLLAFFYAPFAQRLKRVGARVRFVASKNREEEESQREREISERARVQAYL